MHPVLGVRRLWIGAVQLVRRLGHVSVARSVVRLPGPPPAQCLVGPVEPPAHLGEPLVAALVERPGGLRPPELVLLGDQRLDPVQNRLLVHASRIPRGP